jgi:hypothetical protein
MLKGYAVSQCFSRSYPNSDVAISAEAAASGYLEFGSSELDIYQKSVEIVGRKLKQVYRSMVGNSFHAMKCIDLFFEPELDALARSIPQ